DRGSGPARRLPRWASCDRDDCRGTRSRSPGGRWRAARGRGPAPARSVSRARHDVDEPIGNDDHLLDAATLDPGPHALVAEGHLADPIVGRVDIDEQAAAHLAVDLDDDRDLRLLERCWIDHGPALLEEALAVAELRPELLGHVRTEGAEQQQGRLDRFAHERDALGGGAVAGGLESLERVDELHDRGDRGVEVELALDVVGYALDRLVDRATE